MYLSALITIYTGVSEATATVRFIEVLFYFYSIQYREIGREAMERNKDKRFGRGANACRRCGRRRGLIRRYGIYLCRQCFREIARDIGFKKYN